MGRDQSACGQCTSSNTGHLIILALFNRKVCELAVTSGADGELLGGICPLCAPHGQLAPNYQHPPVLLTVLTPAPHPRQMVQTPSPLGEAPRHHPPSTWASHVPMTSPCFLPFPSCQGRGLGQAAESLACSSCLQPQPLCTAAKRSFWPPVGCRLHLGKTRVLLWEDEGHSTYCPASLSPRQALEQNRCSRNTQTFFLFSQRIPTTELEKAHWLMVETGQVLAECLRTSLWVSEGMAAPPCV